MTSPVHGSVADLYYNGKKLSTFFKSASFSQSRDTAETTTFKSTTKSYIPGLRDNTLSADGLLDTDESLSGTSGVGLGAESNIQKSLESTTSTPAFVSYFPAGAESGNDGYSLFCHSTSVQVSTDIGDAAQISVEFQGTNGTQKGKVVATGSPTSPSLDVDGGLGVASGKATAVIQVTASTSLVFTVQDSADGTTWADLAGTTTAATPGSYLIEKSNVRRYVRLTWTGSGTFTAVLGRGK